MQGYHDAAKEMSYILFLDTCLEGTRGSGNNQRRNMWERLARATQSQVMASRETDENLDWMTSPVLSCLFCLVVALARSGELGGLFVLMTSRFGLRVSISGASCPACRFCCSRLGYDACKMSHGPSSTMSEAMSTDIWYTEFRIGKEKHFHT